MVSYIILIDMYLQTLIQQIILADFSLYCFFRTKRHVSILQY